MSKSTKKVCGVCGDRASGYNFNAISCESCKAFFRRNALKENKLKCFFENNCQIDVTTRKFCQHCRLQKCLIIGMKKQLILSDEEKQLIKNKIKENKQKRLKVNDSSNSSDSQTFSSHFLSLNKHLRNLIATPLTQLPPQPQQPCINEANQSSQSSQRQFFHMNHHLNHSNHTNQPNIDSNSNPLKHIFSFENLNQIYQSETYNQWNSSDHCDLTCATFIKVNISGLNAIEIKRLNELSFAFTRIKSESTAIPSDYWQYSDILKLTDQAVRRIIEMSKKIDCYRSLCQTDQAALMKAACTQMIMLRSVCNWNEDRNYWTIVKDDKNSDYFKFDILKQCLIPRIYELHKKFMSLLAHEWDFDSNILNLLTMIVLFNPKTPEVQHKHLIEYERHSHKYLLQRYLDIKYGTKCLANEKFYRLMDTLDHLYILNEENVRLYLQSDHDAIGPLLVDLFDLIN